MIGIARDEDWRIATLQCLAVELWCAMIIQGQPGLLKIETIQQGRAAGCDQKALKMRRAGMSFLLPGKLDTLFSLRGLRLHAEMENKLIL